VKDSE